MMIIAMAIAVTASAGTVSWWAELSNSETGTNPEGVTYHVFALGQHASEPVFDGNTAFTYNPSTSTAMFGTYPVYGSPFAFVSDELYVETGWTDLTAAWGNPVAGDSASFSPANQWWAIVVIDDATPDLYNFHVFRVWEITDTFVLVNKGLDSYPLDVGVYAVTIIPEPATAMLALAGIGLLMAQRRKRA